MKKLLLMLETPSSVMCEPSLKVMVVLPPDVTAVPATLLAVSVEPLREIRSFDDWLKPKMLSLPVEVAPSSQAV